MQKRGSWSKMEKAFIRCPLRIASRRPPSARLNNHAGPYHLLVGWSSSEDFQALRGLVRHFFTALPVVQYIEQAIVGILGRSGWHRRLYDTSGSADALAIRTRYRMKDFPIFRSSPPHLHRWKHRCSASATPFHADTQGPPASAVPRCLLPELRSRIRRGLSHPATRWRAHRARLKGRGHQS